MSIELLFIKDCPHFKAEALVNHFLKGKWVAFSAGIMPMQLNKDVIKVMAEIGIDISLNKSKHISTFNNCAFNTIIKLCKDVERQMHYFRQCSWSTCG